MDGFKAFREHFKTLKDPEHKEALGRALDAFEGIWNDDTCDKARLDVVVEVAGAAATTLWSSGMEMLVQLASRDEAARDAFVVLARSRKASQRFAAIAVMDGRLPRPIVLDVLKAGLFDKSTKVRGHAFMRCNDLGAKELVEEMTRVAATLEGKAREEADWYIAMTRDGYALELGEDRAWITITYPWGSIKSAMVTLEEAAPDRIEATIARLRKEAEDDHAWGERLRARDEAREAAEAERREQLEKAAAERERVRDAAREVAEAERRERVAKAAAERERLGRIQPGSEDE
jgi:hypothetical protein